MRAAGLLLLLLAGLVQAEEPAAPPVADVFAERADSYDVTWHGMNMGRGTIALVPLDHHCYRLRSTTRPMALVRWLYGAPGETSEFCRIDGRIEPRRFEYQIDGREQDDFTLDFDWPKRTVKTIKGGEVRVRDLPGPAYDRFVLHIVIRQWVMEHAGDEARVEREFLMVDDKQIRPYRFAISGRETIDTPAGRFATVRVERTDNPDKSSRFWVAPDRAFIPVRIEQIEKGKQTVLMELRP
jgi:hypothetical protein